MDGVLNLRQRLGLNAQNLERLECRMPPGGMRVLIYPRPTTGLEGKFSMEYCVAAALCDGDVKLATFTDEAIARPEVKRLTGLVRITEDGPPARTALGGSALVSIQLEDGSTRSSKLAEVPRGDPQNPLSWEQLAAKFTDCARERFAPDDIRRAIAAIEGLDDTPARELAAAVAQSRATSDAT